MGSSGGGGSTNTVQEIPAYEQAESQSNQQLANSLASTPYTPYPTGDLISPLTQDQQNGILNTDQSAYDFQTSIAQAANTLGQTNGAAAQPYMDEANSYAGIGTQFLGQAQTEAGLANPFISEAQGEYGAANQNFSAAGGEIGAANSAYGTAQALTNPNAIAGYMSPYIQASLAPQLSDLSLQNAQQQQQINTQATQAGAFGDARQGAAQGLQNYYTDQATNQVTSQAYQNAFTAANQALGNAQNTNINAGSGYANAGGQFVNAGTGYNNAGTGLENAAGVINQNAGVYNSLAGQAGTLSGDVNQIGTNALNQQNTLLNQANAYTALGSANQQLGLTGANAELSAGQLEQTQAQNVANANYQQYLNQTNYPFQMLNVREGAIANSPYNINTATTLPAPNSVQQGVGVAQTLSGLVGQIPKS
jgi:hypothetical protein